MYSCGQSQGRSPGYFRYDSNSLRGIADCLMIDWSVPVRISGWFGTGTVIVDSESFFCMMM
jgi:hypothetical protein